MALTESVRAGEFILSEGNGRISREVVTIASGEGVLEAGTVLGVVTASGEYAAYDAGAADGSETAAGVLYSKVDATSAAVDAVAIVRLAEVDGGSLTGNDADGTTDLAANNIIVR